MTHFHHYQLESTRAESSGVIEYPTTVFKEPNPTALFNTFPVGLLGKFVETTDVANVGKILPESISLLITVIVLFTIQFWYENGPGPQLSVVALGG